MNSPEACQSLRSDIFFVVDAALIFLLRIFVHDGSDSLPHNTLQRTMANFPISSIDYRIRTWEAELESFHCVSFDASSTAYPSLLLLPSPFKHTIPELPRCPSRISCSLPIPILIHSYSSLPPDSNIWHGSRCRARSPNLMVCSAVFLLATGAIPPVQLATMGLW